LWESPKDWDIEVAGGRVSPRYGVAVPIVRLMWSRTGTLTELTMVCTPAESSSAVSLDWTRDVSRCVTA
ncbi:MAG: hypothetical protein ACRD1T_17400, partial [Acidimicrobiia bacterium]